MAIALARLGLVGSSLICLAGLCSCNNSISSNDRPASRETLVTGKGIASSINATQEVGNMPINLAISPDGKYLVTTDCGHYEALWSISTADGKGVSHVDYNNSPETTGGEANTRPLSRRADESNGLYYGVVISPDNTVYASQGGHDTIAVLHLDDSGTLTSQDTIKTKPRDFPAGLALDDAGRIYVANNAAGLINPYKMPGSVAIYDAAKKTELGRYTFSDSHYGTSNFPMGIAALRDGSKAYVASERDDAVYVLDTRDAATPTLKTKLDTGAHPVAVVLSKDGSRLFVANSLSDTISIINTSEDRIIGTVLLRPRAARDLPGVSPVGLAISPDQKTLYAALGDMNAVAVIDIDDAELTGYIPTGWYPSSLAVTPDGKNLLVTNAKGSNLRNPNNVPTRAIPSATRSASPRWKATSSGSRSRRVRIWKKPQSKFA
jgi:YVTN family beta-propeller protein